MITDLDKYKVDISEGVSGDWKVHKYEVSRQSQKFAELWCACNPQFPARIVPAGVYTMLSRMGTIVMTDTPDEIRDHLKAIEALPDFGHALIGGLGLGMVAEAMLKKHDEIKVTVIELSKDVIELVAPTLKERYGDRLEVINADISIWEPPHGIYYDVVWLDIWDTICMDNLEEMQILREKYLRKASWRGCWQEDGCRAQRNRIKSEIGFY